MAFLFSEIPRISVESTRYVRCSVSATESGLLVDPTESTVQFAFKTDTSHPGSGDWETASWETAGSEYFGRCLVGPDGSVELAAGDYIVWIKFALDVETVIESVGDLTIY